MAGWIKMPLGTEADLDPRDSVTWEPPPPKKGGAKHQPILARALWPNSCMDQDATWYAGRPWPRPRATWGPSSPLKGV